MQRLFRKLSSGATRRDIGRSKEPQQWRSLQQVRGMGGGQRTYPGGMKPWEWKRKHERIKREKERVLLRQDRTVYESRLRSELRAEKMVETATTITSMGMSSQEQIAALASRFVLKGADDLWNEADGPDSSTSCLPDFDDRDLNPRKWHKDTGDVKLHEFESYFNPYDQGGFEPAHASATRPRKKSFRSTWGGMERGRRGFCTGGRSFCSSSTSDCNGTKKVDKKGVAVMTIDKIKLPNVQIKGSLTRLNRFDQFNISPLSIKALSEAGYMEMEYVQKTAIPSILEGNDVFVKCKSGMGSVLAFAIPAVEKVIQSCQHRVKKEFVVVIICSTQERCSEVTAVTNLLLRYHSNVGAQSLLDANSFHSEQLRLKSDPCQVLVATPERFLEHTEQTPGFSNRLLGVKMLIVDDAEELLDQEHGNDVEMISDSLPRQKQTLLFSQKTTLRVQNFSLAILKRAHTFMDATGVRYKELMYKFTQKYVITCQENHIPLLFQILNEHIAETPNYMVMIFCSTEAVRRLLFQSLSKLQLNIREVRLAKTKADQIRVSRVFANSKNIIFLTTYSSSKGLSFPHSSLVVQMGLSLDRREYIQKLCRTGHVSKIGRSILLLAPLEECFLVQVSDMSLMKMEVPDLSPETISKVNNVLASLSTHVKESAYFSWLHFYYQHPFIGRQRSCLVDFANSFARAVGMQTPPSFSKGLVEDMSLKNIAGVRISDSSSYEDL